MLKQHAADQWPDRGPRRPDRAPKAKRHGPFTVILEGFADQPQNTGHDHGAPQCQKHSGGDHGSSIWGIGCPHGRETENDQPRQQNRAVANPI